MEGADGFTPRQLEVLRLLRQGKPNKIIAYELDVEESTVKVHVRHIMRKLKATNRTHAVVLANQLSPS
jgi:DNA-binding NarL/FixJ family response regulator